ncbi:hypothetical protein LOZ53_002515 [Ophidiomyces ophidiicola]|nr:hypothetical protein LOZ55_002506 [Ophidiomyces ophidiicola]KAI1988024.1 hypothetical protein LOZ51_005504 [Ophidiomyces ophidiicola]KAI1991659.1 hypothetical protein LOZ54_002034 [Ophidiomyces ophidiicola]KAI1992330.1 hypothetical protein LOZ53_002515 [Ophidiomyces ophidiicola]
MGDSLEERLRSHADAFDGLLSLIPAKYYYGEDTSDQWQRKKQTKEQARNAKRAKLDPNAAKTAKDVMDENARKRKREDGQPDSDEHELGSEKPREGLKRGNHKTKKQKKTESMENQPPTESIDNTQPTARSETDGRLKKKQDQKATKQEHKKQKQDEKAEKRKEKKKQKDKQPKVVQDHPDTAPEMPGESDPRSPEENDDDDGADEIAPIEGFSIQNASDKSDIDSSATSSPAANSALFDASNLPSGNSSISSAIPPTEDNTSNKKQEQTLKPKTPKSTPEELKDRLQKRLDELRAARHADGFNGKPAKNRQELIEARRQREEQRRAHKKEMRQKAKDEEQRLRDEAIAKRFSSKGSLLASPGSPAESITSIQNNFSFGRVIFADGQTTDANLTTLREQKKHRGAQDATTALKAAEAKKERLASLDEKKRADIEEKDMWLNAKKRAHGEKVKDDVSLLKKALQRKESIKKKSEKQWKERIEGVTKSKDARQAKREENIRKRREEKGSKGKKGKAKARPGFEGSFKTKAGGKKK